MVPSPRGAQDAPITRQGFGRASLPDANVLKRQESDNASVTSASTCASSAGASDMGTPLDHLTVDWLLQPDLTTDPWFEFLINHNWEAKAVGPINSWSTMLRQCYTTILASREPRVLYWENDLLLLYDEHARFFVGELHPAVLGEPLKQAWDEAVHTEITKMIRSGIKRGRPIAQTNYELVLTRHSFPESCFLNLVFLPIPSPDGHYLGVLAEFTETTEKVLQRNRQQVSKSLLESFSKASDLHHLWQTFREMCFSTLHKPLLFAPNIRKTSLMTCSHSPN
jgi:hypothetical protein